VLEGWMPVGVALEHGRELGVEPLVHVIHQGLRDRSAWDCEGDKHKELLRM
jgi:hypothetical protein